MGDKLIEKLYFGFLLLLPLVFSSTIVDSVLIPRQLLLTGFVFVLVVVLLTQQKALLFNYKSPLFYASVGFLLLNLISFAQSTVPSESHAVFSKLALIFSFFLITTTLLFNNVIRFDKLVLAVIFFGLITLCFPYWDLIEKTIRGEHLLRRIELIKGNAANKNLLSSVLFLCLPFYCIGLKQVKWIKLLSAFALLATLFILATIRTRVVLIAVILFFALLLCYQIKQRFSVKKRYFVIIGLVFALTIGLSAKFYLERRTTNTSDTTPSNVQKYFSRLSDSKTLESRILFWQKSMQMSKEHFLLGVGDGNWQIQFPKYGLNDFSEYDMVNGESTLQRPHNDFVWILCETGILGLLIYLVLFGLVFYQCYSLMKQTANPTEKWNFHIIFSAIIGYLLISFFDFPYERIEHQVILMLLLSIVFSFYLKTKPTTNLKFKPLILAISVAVVYSAIVCFYRYNGEQHAAKMYTAKKNKNWNETIYEAKKATNYFYQLDNMTMPLSWYEGIGHFNEGRMSDSENCFYKAYQLTPYNIQVINNLASVYQVNGRMDEALNLYQEALKISKHFDEAKLNLAAFYFNRKEFDKAYSTINEVKTDSRNPKYKTYLVPILNNKINTFLKTAKDKTVIANLVKNVTTKEALLQLFFEAKKNKVSFETYLTQVKF